MNRFMRHFEFSKARSIAENLRSFAPLSPFTETAVMVIDKFIIHFVGKDAFIPLCFEKQMIEFNQYHEDRIKNIGRILFDHLGAAAQIDQSGSKLL